MNEELQKKLTGILSDIQSATKVAGDFAIDQLPDIAQSYLVYGRIVAGLDVLVWLVLFVLLAYLAIVKGFLNTSGILKEGVFRGDWTTTRMMSASVGGFGGAISGVIFKVSMDNLLLVWISPKVWLIKEMSRIVG